jgi:hypothetical protein
MTPTIFDYFRRYRRDNPKISAEDALRWARSSVAVDAISRQIDWLTESDNHRLLDIGRLDEIEVRVYIDDEPYDWGDCEPSPDDCANLEVIGVGVRVVDDIDDLDAIWSVAYFDHDYRRAAIETAVDFGFIELARNEISERARLAGYVETER